jgi:outer membrane protein OmpA-like peptidoglycan-associated protein
VSWRSLAACAVVAALTTGCATKRSVVLLLPDEDGTVGRAGVSNQAGAVELVEARSAAVVAKGRAPQLIKSMSDADVAQKFGETLASLPAAPIRFTVYFQFDSDTLTDESRRLVPRILATVKERAAREVIVVGHTDRMGSTAENFALGLKRATAVRGLLTTAGLNSSIVEVTSLGEADPVVRTANGQSEPRNRRVEIVVHPRQQ